MQSLDVLADVSNSIESSAGDCANVIRHKLNKLISKNTGLDKITKIATTLSGEIVDLDLPPNIISLYKYAPLTSCDVERSFSTYKSILVDKRKSFKLENLEMYMICHCNAFYDVNDE